MLVLKTGLRFVMIILIPTQRRLEINQLKMSTIKLYLLPGNIILTIIFHLLWLMSYREMK